MARRTKGEGTLRKRKDGRWEGWFNIGKDENGKTKRKSVTAKTKSECQEKLNKAKEEAIKRIASERNNGQRIAKNAQKKVGGIIAIIMAVVIALAIILFDFGKKNETRLFWIIRFSGSCYWSIHTLCNLCFFKRKRIQSQKTL